MVSNCSNRCCHAHLCLRKDCCDTETHTWTVCLDEDFAPFERTFEIVHFECRVRNRLHKFRKRTVGLESHPLDSERATLMIRAEQLVLFKVLFPRLHHVGRNPDVMILSSSSGRSILSLAFFPPVSPIEKHRNNKQKQEENKCCSIHQSRIESQVQPGVKKILDVRSWQVSLSQTSSHVPMPIGAGTVANPAANTQPEPGARNQTHHQ